jgi:hypothetical protein
MSRDSSVAISLHQVPDVRNAMGYADAAGENQYRAIGAQGM